MHTENAADDSEQDLTEDTWQHVNTAHQGRVILHRLEVDR